MSPFVIDGKKKRQYVGIFIFSIIISFALGFFSGHYTNLTPASQSYDQLKTQIFNETEIVNEDQATQPQPEADEKKTDDKEGQVDKPVKKTEVRDEKKVEEKKLAEKKLPPAKPQPAKPKPVTVTPPPPPKAVVKVAPVVKPVAKVETATAIAEQPKKPPVESQATPPPETQSPAQPAIDTMPVTPPEPVTEPLPVAGPMPGNTENSPAENTGKQKYAVQVGLFANRDNAQKLVYELIDNGYDAYMDEFVSSSGEVKYNVRFGRFADRASVQSKLAEYKQAYTTPAYIIITK